MTSRVAQLRIWDLTNVFVQASLSKGVGFALALLNEARLSPQCLQDDPGQLEDQVRMKRLPQ
jgi:hypothetical protein